MSFIFSDLAPSKLGEASPRIPASTYYGAAFEQGVHDSMLGSIYRWSDYQATLDPDPFFNPYISRQTAENWARRSGVQGLEFEDDMTQEEVGLLIKRKYEEQNRYRILAAGGQGATRKVGMFGTAFLGSIANPLDLPLMFIPVVGSASKAATLSKAGKVGASYLARGLITEEALIEHGLLLKGYTAAMLEGSIGQAITEIPLIVANKQEQADYGLENSMLNIAMGAGFGAAIHTFRLGFRNAKSLHSRLSKTTKENMATGAMDDFLRGKDLDPARYLDLDEVVVEGKNMGKVIDDLERADAEFKERLERELTPAQREIWEWNKNNKLRDTQGLPLVVYHGRTWKGEQFDPLMMGKNTRAGSARKGFFFAGSARTSQYYIIRAAYQNDPKVMGILDEMSDAHRRIAKDPAKADKVLTERLEELKQQLSDRYGLENVFREGGNVSAFMLKMENPKIIDLKGEFHRPKTYADIIDEAKAAGHDGVVIKNTFDGGPLDDVYVVFDKDQIRSAYQYRVANDAQARAAKVKGAIDDFKKREQAKAQKHQEELDKDIDNLESPGPPRIHEEVPTNEEVRLLEEEIERLTDELGIDPRVVGNVHNVHEPPYSPHSISVPEAVRFHAEISKAQWQKIIGKKDGLTVGDFAAAIDQLSPKHAQVLKKIIEMNPDLEGLKVRFDPDLDAKGFLGTYHGQTDTIQLSSAIAPRTIVHEAVHATAVRKVRNAAFGELPRTEATSLFIARGSDYLNRLSRFANTTKNEPLRELIKTYVRAVEIFAMKHDPTIRQLLNGDERVFIAGLKNPHYGLLNIDEFIAEAVSNRRFQDFLRSMNSTKSRTLFSDFVTAIKRLLGFEESNSMLDDVLESYERFVKKGERANANNLPYRVSKPVAKMIMYHGSTLDFDSPTGVVFTAKRKLDASWFSFEGPEGTGLGKIYKLDLDIKNPFNAEKLSIDDLVRRAGLDPADVTPIRKNSPYDGTNENDWIYVPEVREQLAKEGYDGFTARDLLESSEIDIAVPLKESQIRVLGKEDVTWSPTEGVIFSKAEPRATAKDLNELALAKASACILANV